MPVRFYCKKCDTLLSIGTKKIGKQIECPKCKTSMTVPEKDEPKRQKKKVLATVGATKSEPGPVQQEAPGPEPIDLDKIAEQEGLIKEFIVFETLPDDPPIDPALSNPADNAPLGDGTKGVTDDSKQTSRRPEKEIKNGIYISRWTIFLQAVVILFGCGLFLIMGFAMGRIIPPATPEDPLAGANVDNKSVLIEASLQYQKSPGEIVADENSIVIALPFDVYPAEKFSHDGIRPIDEVSAKQKNLEEAIQKLGGSLGRADADGKIIFNVPSQGEYFILFISRNKKRPENKPLEENDREIMSNYFRSPFLLIEQQDYLWQSKLLESAGEDLGTHVFK